MSAHVIWYPIRSKEIDFLTNQPHLISVVLLAKKRVQLTKEMEVSVGSDEAEERADDEDSMVDE
jgi:hypothetical protein